jgi:hypothetical protein
VSYSVALSRLRLALIPILINEQAVPGSLFASVFQ